MKRNRWRLLLLAVNALLASGAHAAGPLAYLGQQIVPAGTMQFGTAMGGLSGIDFDAASGRYFAITDDRSEIDLARFYELRLDLAQFRRSNTPGSAGVRFEAVHPILTPGGSPFAPRQLDAEAIRFDGADLYWSSEGARESGNFQNPFVRRMTVSGQHVAQLDTPARFNPSGSVAGTQPGDRGVRNSAGFESLTLSTDRTRLYTATTNALVQDGPPSGIGQPSVSRVIAFDTGTGNPTAEYAYVVGPLVQEPTPPSAFAANSLVELVSIGDRRFIAVELSFSTGRESTVRLYYADARGASDISNLDSLLGASFTPMAKSLLLDLADLRNDDGSPLVVGAIEGITFGPSHEGRPTLILASDDNFGSGQFTQFIALSRVGPIPEPATCALMSAGWISILLAKRALRRRKASA